MTTVPVGAPPAAGLPDVNALTHPYDVVQYHLDKAEWVNLYAVPVPGHPAAAWITGDREDYFGIDGGYGLAVRSRLRRFDARLLPPRGASLSVDQRVGREMGELSGRFLFGPEDVAWAPGREPPIRMFDPWRPQSFAMLDLDLDLGGGDGFVGYGSGRTVPVSAAGRPVLLAGGVGNVVRGRGRLAGLQATFVLNGVIRDLGFEGNVTCRVVDPEGRLSGDGEPPAVDGTADVTPLSTFVVLRGEKAGPEVRTEYGPPPAPGEVSLLTPAVMRAVELRTAGGGEGLRCRRQVGQVAAGLVADVSLDILAPPGTGERPNAFTTHNVYTFHDAAGGTAGRVEADVTLGRSFALRFPGLPDQPAMRYGGVGPIVGGAGRFQGAVGMLAVNSAIGVAPHALSMINVLQIVDPAAALRTGRGAE